MAIDSASSGLDIRRANRRGFLMGVTLAELMLITLFVLLLLLESFGQIEEDIGGPEAVDAVRELAEDVERWAEEQERPLPEIWRNLIPRSKGSRSDLETHIRNLEEKHENLEAQLSENNRELAKANLDLTETKQRLDQAYSQQSELESELRDEHSQNKILKAEVARSKQELAAANTDRARTDRRIEQEQERRAELEEQIKALEGQIETEGEERGPVGGLVLCAYGRPATEDALHGPSVALGTVHLQHDGITMIHKRPGLRNLEVVDKVGDHYDLTDALDQLDSWPLGTKRTFEAFRSWGREFVRIGDREARKRQKCRFSMGYYIAEGVDSDVLTDVFERYFFKQPLNSISKQEYQRLIGTGANADTR